MLSLTQQQFPLRRHSEYTSMNNLAILLVLPAWATAQNQYLMTVGGYEGSTGCQNCNNRVSLISLDPQLEVPECLRNLSDFKNLEGACMANLLGDQPHICGGYDAYIGYNNECYRYNPTLDTWRETGTLLEERIGGSGLYGCGFTYSHGIVVAGGTGFIDGCIPDGPGAW